MSRDILSDSYQHNFPWLQELELKRAEIRRLNDQVRDTDEKMDHFVKHSKRKLVTDMYSWMEQFRSHQINAEATLNEFEREVSALSQERERRALKIDQWNKRLQRSLQHYNFSYDPIGGSLASSYRLKPPPPPRNGVHAWGGQVGSFESDFGETEEEETETETESVVEGEERAFTMYKGKSSSSFGISGGIDIPSLMYEDYSHIPDLSEEELQAALFVIEQNQTDYLQELQELEEKEEYKE